MNIFKEILNARLYFHIYTGMYRFCDMNDSAADKKFFLFREIFQGKMISISYQSIDITTLKYFTNE